MQKFQGVRGNEICQSRRRKAPAALASIDSRLRELQKHMLWCIKADLCGLRTTQAKMKEVLQVRAGKKGAYFEMRAHKTAKMARLWEQQNPPRSDFLRTP